MVCAVGQWLRALHETAALHRTQAAEYLVGRLKLLKGSTVGPADRIAFENYAFFKPADIVIRFHRPCHSCDNKQQYSSGNKLPRVQMRHIGAQTVFDHKVDCRVQRLAETDFGILSAFDGLAYMLWHPGGNSVEGSVGVHRHQSLVGLQRQLYFKAHPVAFVGAAGH